MFPKIGNDILKKRCHSQNIKNYKDNPDLLLGRKNHFKKKTDVIHLFRQRKKIVFHVRIIQQLAFGYFDRFERIFSR